jgi:hypothetical protein
MELFSVIDKSCNASLRDSPVVPNMQWERARREGYETSLLSFAENALAGTKP